MKQTDEINFKVTDNSIPKITINGDEVGVVSLSYQYVTLNPANAGTNMFIASVLVGDGQHQMTVYHDCVTGSTFMQ